MSKHIQEGDTAGGHLNGTYPNPSIDTGLFVTAGQGVPSGGTTGQILAKASAANYDDTWIDPASAALVTSVFSRIGDVLAVANDYTASQVTNVPAGNIAATSVQDAIDELDTEKEPNLGFTAVPNTRTVAGHALSSNVTLSASDVSLGSVTNDAQLKVSDKDTDGTLAANSDSKIASQKAVKTYVDAAVTGGVTFKGNWDASTNTPTLADGVGTAGDEYAVSVGATRNLGSGSVVWAAGDFAIYNGTIWQKISGSGGVASVFGRSGTVTATSGDYTGTQVTNTPAGSIAATTVQAAINELDSEKQASLGYTAANDANVIHTTGDETAAGTKTFSSPIDMDDNDPINPLNPGFQKAATGITVYGHSWAAEIGIQQFQSTVGYPTTRETQWTELLKRRFGLKDNIRTFYVPQVAAANNETTALFVTEDYGAITSCTFYPMATGGGTSRAWSLNTTLNSAILYSITSPGVTAGVPLAITSSTNRVGQVIRPGDVITWVSAKVGAGTQDVGGVVVLVVQGEFSNYAIGGSTFCLSGVTNSGWSKYDYYINKQPMSSTTARRGRNRNDYGLYHQDGPNGTIGLCFAGQNDLGLYGTGTYAAFKEALRFIVGKHKVYVHFKTTLVTDVNGDGGGVWSNPTSAAGSEFTNEGTYSLFTGAVGTSTPTSKTITFSSPQYTGQDVGISLVALAGAQGYDYTITIDGATPNWAGGVRINNAQVNSFSTTSVSSTFSLPIYKRISGLSAGAHTVKITLTARAAGSPQFIFNWWGWEARVPPNPFFMANLPYLLESHSPTYVADMRDHGIVDTWNAVYDEIAAEWTDNSVVVVDINTAMNEQHEYFATDGLHPSDKGHQLIAKEFYKAIQNAVEVENIDMMFR